MCTMVSAPSYCAWGLAARAQHDPLPVLLLLGAHAAVDGAMVDYTKLILVLVAIL